MYRPQRADEKKKSKYEYAPVDQEFKDTEKKQVERALQFLKQDESVSYRPKKDMGLVPLDTTDHRRQLVELGLSSSAVEWVDDFTSCVVNDESKWDECLKERVPEKFRYVVKKLLNLCKQSFVPSIYAEDKTIYKKNALEEERVPSKKPEKSPFLDALGNLSRKIEAMHLKMGTMTLSREDKQIYEDLKNFQNYLIENHKNIQLLVESGDDKYAYEGVRLYQKVIYEIFTSLKTKHAQNVALRNILLAFLKEDVPIDLEHYINYSSYRQARNLAAFIAYEIKSVINKYK